jgi:calcineurin-like phosphoesterase family protein
MRILVITDTHFGHRALVEKYESRPPDFETRIKQNWQKMVNNDDLVIHLGDVVVGKTTDWTSLVPTLPGQKVLVLGNHDKKSTSWYMANGFNFCCLEFFWEVFGVRILFSHEPREEGQFDLNIHGHLHLPESHRKYKTGKRHFLVSLEETNYQPRPLKSIVAAWRKSNS